jgi:hypothetical protein
MRVALHGPTGKFTHAKLGTPPSDWTNQSLPAVIARRRRPESFDSVNDEAKRRTWAQSEGSPLPLGTTWIEAEQAFNFSVYAEHAESVTLLLYALSDLVNPVLAFQATL